ncbi:Ig-like domain-containing protein [Escherichia coli]|nr:Ig-like domain-containing protein [Escherichia coli]
MANGKDAFTLTANVEDKNGNPVPGSLVTFNLPRVSSRLQAIMSG